MWRNFRLNKIVVHFTEIVYGLVKKILEQIDILLEKSCTLLWKNCTFYLKGLLLLCNWVITHDKNVNFGWYRCKEVLLLVLVLN